MDARKYFFTKLRSFSEMAAVSGQRKINFEAYSQEWNRAADGETRFYITPEVLATYAKSWEKVSNIRASKELMYTELESAKISSRIFAAENLPFPAFLTGDANQIQPLQGVRDLQATCGIPQSLAIDVDNAESICHRV
ncbi:hypothetical protein H1R20_g6985, partial [Candolleomyces eurysporus]